MELVGIALIIIASALFVVSSIMVLVQAFKKSLLWGFGSLFIPLVELAFVFLNWEETKQYVVWLLLSIILFVVGGLIG